MHGSGTSDQFSYSIQNPCKNFLYCFSFYIKIYIFFLYFCCPTSCLI